MGIEKLLHLSGHNTLSSTSVIRRRPLECLIWTILFILYIHYINRHPPPNPTSPTQPPPLDDIPAKIWQIFFNHTPIDPYTPSIQTWITKNQDYQYTLVSASGGNALALKHYAKRREILYPFLSLHNPTLRSHLLRYMLLESEGGIYSDLDTAAQKPISEYIPPNLTSKIRAVIGIEYDHSPTRLDIERPQLQFSQRTIAASRGHPLLSHTIATTITALHELASIKNATTIAELRPTEKEVAELSGPGLWTRVVLKKLSEVAGTELNEGNFTGMEEPRVVGDVLVLPVGGFGRGRKLLGRGEGEGDGLVGDGLVGDGVGGRTRGWGE